VDHVVEVALGGMDVFSNWQILSGPSNSIKSNAVNKYRNVKTGKTKSRPFRIRLVHTTHHGAYRLFDSTYDPDIDVFAAHGTTNRNISVHKAHLREMMNGKRKRVGVNRRPGYFVVAHPDDVRTQAIERKDFGGQSLPQDFIDDLGHGFKSKKGATRLLFHMDGRVYNNTGQITRGYVDPRTPFGLVRVFSGTKMHTLLYYSHIKKVHGVHDNASPALVQKRLQKTHGLVIAHDESHPLTYILFRCHPGTRKIDHCSQPLDNLTFDEFMTLSDTEQRSLRVMYSNHVDTLRLATSQENTLESTRTHSDMYNAHQLYQIHMYQKHRREIT
jgi:hypothetical protein